MINRDEVLKEAIQAAGQPMHDLDEAIDQQIENEHHELEVLLGLVF